MQSRRKIIGRAVLCFLVLATTLAIALVVGDSSFHATAVGWLPFLTCLCVIAMAGAYTLVAARTLRFSDNPSQSSCVRGHGVPFSVTLENKGPLILLNVTVELFVADISGDVTKTTNTTVTLNPFSKVEIPFNVPFEHVGKFSAGLNSVEFKDFLGLFSYRIKSQRVSSICVLPAVPSLGSMKFSEDAEEENFKMLKTALADSLDYAYVREYEIGDPLKTIHWKLSARTDDLLTRLFEKTVSPCAVVLLDFYVPKEYVEEAPAGALEEAMELRDTVVEAGLSIANYARDKGLDVEVRFVDRYGDTRTLEFWDASSIIRLVEDMPSTSFDDTLGNATVGALLDLAKSRKAHNNVIICSANLKSEMTSAVTTAKTMRKSPFFVAAVPHRLVDKDYDLHISPLSLLQDCAVSYEVVTRSQHLQGREI